MPDESANEQPEKFTDALPIVREMNPNLDEVLASIEKHEADALKSGNQFMLDLAAQSRKERGLPPRGET